MKLCIKSMTLCLCLSMGFACSMAYGQSIGAEEDPFPPELQVDPLIPPTPPEEELPRDPGNALVFPNARVNQDAGTNPQNETTIAVNPLGIDNYVAGANDYRAGDSRCGFYYSADSAQTWHDGMAALAGVLPLQAGYTSGGDPAVAFDNAGRAYYACMNFNRVNNNTGMYVFRSTDGGQTYPLSALVVSGIGPIDFNDKEYIATDKFTNNVYMSWTHFIPGASPIMFAGSPAAPFAFNSPLPKVIRPDLRSLVQRGFSGKDSGSENHQWGHHVRPASARQQYHTASRQSFGRIRQFPCEQLPHPGCLPQSQQPFLRAGVCGMGRLS
jgi:hypothetical protein